MLMLLFHTNNQIGEIAPEISLMQMLDHPNIVKFLGSEVDETNGLLYIFMERVSGGSIKSTSRRCILT